MENYTWIYQLSAGGALIFFFYLLLRFVIGRITESLCRLEKTLTAVNQSMVNRDQIILNHLEHFVESLQEITQAQTEQAQIIERICRELSVDGGGRK